MMEGNLLTLVLYLSLSLTFIKCRSWCNELGRKTGNEKVTTLLHPPPQDLKQYCKEYQYSGIANGVPYEILNW